MTVTSIIEEARAKVGDDWEQIARHIAGAFVNLSWESEERRHITSALSEEIKLLREEIENKSSSGYTYRPPKRCLPRKSAPEAIE